MEWGNTAPHWDGRDSLRADDEIRTRDIHLGKVVLYQLSYVRIRPLRPMKPVGGAIRNHSRDAPRSPNPFRRGSDYPGPVTLLTKPLAPSARPLTVWSNGRLYADPHDAMVPITDHGLVVGDGVFEALKVTAAGAFAVQRHLNRLTRSAAAMALPAPDHELIREGITAVLADRDFALGKIRITYTGGPGPLGSQAAYGPVTLIVAAEPIDPASPIGTAVTAPWRRNEFGALTGVKSTSYAENVRGLAYATAQGASESIFANTAGHVCEGTGTNIFCVFGAEVVTPPLASGPLAGVTRELLLEWWSVVERDLTMAEAKAADEVFLTSSMRDVQGVAQWDEITFSSIRPVTDQVVQAFAQRGAADLDP